MEIKINESYLIGEIKYFPIEVIEKMVEFQVIQGNQANVKIFQDNKASTKDGGGFDWEYTLDGSIFWYNVICDMNFEMFFKKYPKKYSKKYPKVMYVSDFNNFEYKVKRVVFMEKNGKFIAWSNSQTLEEAENEYFVTAWEYAIDLEDSSKVVELTLQDISDGKGVGVPPNLIKIINK